MAAEHPPSLPMATATKIIRKSTFTFLQNLHLFTSTPSLLLFPFAIFSLLCPSLTSSSSLFPLIHRRFTSLSLSAGISPQSELFAILNLKLSQTILSFLFLFPFTISSLLAAKTAVIAALDRQKPPQQLLVFYGLLITQFCNFAIILSANATCFSLLIILFNLSDVVGLSSKKYLLLLSATGTILYSIILANAYIVCSLSIVISGTENSIGLNSILKACVLLRGRSATALSLAVPMNMALAGIEALFQYRVVRTYNRAMEVDVSMVFETMVVAYLYGLVLVLDTIVGYVFLRSCKQGYHCQIDQIEIEERGENCFRKVKVELLL